MDKAKVKKFAVVTVPAVMATAVPVFASSGGTYDEVSGAMVTAVTSIASSALGAIGDIVPVAAPVLGAMLIISIGIKTFKRFSGRS